MIFAFFATHRGITVTPHTDGDQVFRVLGSFDALTEEPIDDLLVGDIIPGTVLPAFTGPLLMVAGHWLVMRCAHDNAHVGRCLAVQGVVRIETPAPHGWPQHVGTKSQEQFKHTGIEAMVSVVGAVGMFYPPRQARGLVVEEKAAVFHRRFASRIGATGNGEVLLRLNRYISPVIPRRNTQLFRKFVDTVNSSPAIASCYDQGFIHTFQGVGNHRHYVGFPFPFQQRGVDFLLFHELTDKWTLQGANDDQSFGIRTCQ